MNSEIYNNICDKMYYILNLSFYLNEFNIITEGNYIELCNDLKMNKDKMDMMMKYDDNNERKTKQLIFMDNSLSDFSNELLEGLTSNFLNL